MSTPLQRYRYTSLFGVKGQIILLKTIDATAK
jgi:hypothetical protein